MDVDVGEVKKKIEQKKELQLRKAVLKGDLESVKHFLNLSVDPNWSDINQSSFVHHACLRGHSEVLEYLHSAGANLETVDADGCVPLHNACAQGKKKCVRYLIKQGVKVSVYNNFRWTPVHKAASIGHTTIIKDLKAAGAALTCVDSSGETPLFKAVRCESIKAVFYLIQHSPVSVKVPDCTGEIPLTLAASLGNVELMEELIKVGSDPNSTNNNGDTPLHAGSLHYEAISILLRSGANHSTKNKSGKQPIHLAARKGTKDCVLILLEAGSDPNAQDKSGRAPLHYSAKSNRVETAEVLLAHGADKFLKDKKGNLPIDLTRRHRGVRALLEDPGKKYRAGSNVSPAVPAISVEGGGEPLVLTINGNPRSATQRLQRPPSGKRLPLETVLHQWDDKTTPDPVQRRSKSPRRKHKNHEERSKSPRRRARPSTPRNDGAPSPRLRKRHKSPSPNPKTRSKSGKSTPGPSVDDGADNMVGPGTETEGNTQELKKSTGDENVPKKSKSPEDVMELEADQNERSSNATTPKPTDGGGAGGLLGGGRALPQGTNALDAIDDAILAWSGTPAQENGHGLRKGIKLKKFFKDKKGEGPRNRQFRRPSAGGDHLLNPVSRLGDHPKGTYRLGLSPSSPELCMPDKPYVDRWGFVHATPGHLHELSPQQRLLELESEHKWLKSSRKWKSKGHYTPKAQKKILKQCQIGIPMSVRGVVWKMLCNVEGYKESNKGEYHRLVAIKTEEVAEDQIGRDLHRTFPTHVRFREEGGPGQQALYRVLSAYSNYNPKLGYCQGMGFIAALFLMMMEEEDAFWCLVKMCLPGDGTYMDTMSLDRGYGMQGLFEEDLPMVWECVFVFERLLKLYLPRLNAHFEEEAVAAGTYAPQYFITVFLYNMPFPCVLRIWDLFLVSGYNTVFLCALSLMKINEERMLQMDFDGIMEWVKLQQYCDEEFYFDGESLIEQAIVYMNKPDPIKPKLLDTLREEYKKKKALGEAL